MNKTVDNFTYGTQYYRPPTPLPEEWEDDLKNMDKLGLDTIQLRLQWRWHEPKEGEYYFDDLDKLFELAAKNHKKVIIKFLLENAPDYIFNKYDGARHDTCGRKMPPVSHGAFYCGGWLPCFDNPDVVKKAVEFTETVVKRYRNRPELLLWHIWNEPVSRPVWECGCKHSIKEYRNYLKTEYQTIENYNNFFGKRFESFETVNPPAGAFDFVELFTFRKWAMTAVSKRLNFMYNTVKKLDDTRPIMCHVGVCSLMQDVANSSSDDYKNQDEVDFYGSSFIVYNRLDNEIIDAHPAMQCDWMRSLNKYYWIHELYPSWGAWQPMVSNADYLFKTMNVISGGAKGLFYWQYRAERLGNEHNLSGLTNIDGSLRPFNVLTKKIADFIKDNTDFLMASQVKNDPVAIVYSIDSDLINRIENTGGDGNFWDLSLSSNDGTYLYKQTLAGIYAMFRELGFTVDWIDSRELDKKAKNYQLIYLPEFFMPSEKETIAIRDFVKSGGKLIMEEGAGLRQANTWVNTSWPYATFKELAGSGISDRFYIKEEKHQLDIFGVKITPNDNNFVAYLTPTQGLSAGNWDNGQCAAVKNGNVIYIGTALSAVFHANPSDNSPVNALAACLRSLGIEKNKTTPEKVYLRTLEANGKIMHFIYNRNPYPVQIIMPDNMEICFGETLSENCSLTIKPQDVTVLKTRDKK